MDSPPSLQKTSTTQINAGAAPPRKERHVVLTFRETRPAQPPDRVVAEARQTADDTREHESAEELQRAAARHAPEFSTSMLFLPFSGITEDAFRCWWAKPRTMGLMSLLALLVLVFITHVARQDAQAALAALAVILLLADGFAFLWWRYKFDFFRMSNALHHFSLCVGVFLVLVSLAFAVKRLHIDTDAAESTSAMRIQPLLALFVPILLKILLHLPLWAVGVEAVAHTLIVYTSPLMPGADAIVIMTLVTTIFILVVIEFHFTQSFLLSLATLRHEEELHNVKAEADRVAFRAALQTMKAETDRIAFQTINHAVKRTLLNALDWYEFIQQKVVPKFDTDPAAAHKDMTHTLRALGSGATEGIDICKAIIVQRQIASGKYKSTPAACCLRKLLDAAYGSNRRVSITVSNDVPEMVMLDTTLLKMVAGNVVSNAEMHGEADGPVDIAAGLDTNGELQITVQNQPGPKHEENKRLQAHHGPNHLLDNTQAAADFGSGIGSGDSTLLGCSEIRRAADLMGVRVSLDFAAVVTFTLTMKLIAAPDMGDAMRLPEGTVLMCADDDAIPRAQYTSFIANMKLGPTDKEHSRALGKTYEEAAGLVDTVMKCHAEVGEDKLLCIFDQNMDYTEGTVKGTNVVKELRARGVKSAIFIRSANDDFESMNEYLQAGATGCLSKETRSRELIASIQSAYHAAVQRRV